MPRTITIPARVEHLCEPCPHHHCFAALMGGPGNVWRDYNCMHPEAYASLPLSDDPAVREKQLAMRARLTKNGRHIGKTEAQPDWCPLRKVAP